MPFTLSGSALKSLSNVWAELVLSGGWDLNYGEMDTNDVNEFHGNWDMYMVASINKSVGEYHVESTIMESMGDQLGNPFFTWSQTGQLWRIPK